MREARSGEASLLQNYRMGLGTKQRAPGPLGSGRANVTLNLMPCDVAAGNASGIQSLPAIHRCADRGRIGSLHDARDAVDLVATAAREVGLVEASARCPEAVAARPDAMCAPPSGGALADLAPESSREMGLVGEPDIEGDL